MLRLFLEGGTVWMSLLTLELVALLLAAWKAPGWVKEIGLLALISGILATVIGVRQIGGIIMEIGDVSPSLIWGGYRVALITVIYGLIIYAASLIIRIIQKPRLL